jgi:hypothetical protein
MHAPMHVQRTRETHFGKMNLFHKQQNRYQTSTIAICHREAADKRTYSAAHLIERYQQLHTLQHKEKESAVPKH